MTRPNSLLLTGLLVLSILSLPVAGAEGTSDEKAATYSLRYKFEPGQTLRWQVVHRALIKSTVAGTTQTAETVTKSVKAWRVTHVKEDGTAIFENMVESVDMRQKRTGRQEIRYNSETDKAAPADFAGVPESIGVKLSTITLEPNGKVIDRKREKVQAGAQDEQSEITIPLPSEPVAVGHSWSFPHEIAAHLENRMIKRIKTEQKFTLEEVKTGVAKIKVATLILTPIRDPVVETQIIQRQSSGTVRFDIDAGRIIGQQMDLDKRVIGFAGKNSPTSSLHYLTRFTEDFLSSETAAADEQTDSPNSKTAATDEKADDPGSTTDETTAKSEITVKSEIAAESVAKQSVAAKPDDSNVK